MLITAAWIDLDGRNCQEQIQHAERPMLRAASIRRIVKAQKAG